MSEFTPHQEAAIAAHGNVLVMAGAGTGKTRTLVERCLRLLRAGASLEEMLIVTFTNAAAAEMRARLRHALEAEAGAAGEQAQAFSEQAALLDTAQISTLHSFCLGLVREHFHELGIDPQIVVLDERQTRPLADECLTELLAGHYAGRGPHNGALLRFIRRQGRGSDASLRDIVTRVHRYAQSLPDPDGWLAGLLTDCQQPEPVRWREWLRQAAREWRDQWRPLLDDTPEAPAFERCRAALRSDDDSPAALATALSQVVEADGNWPRGTKKFREDFAKLFEDAAFLHSLLGKDGTGRALQEDWEWSRHEVAALLELTRQFAGRFTEAKRQLGGVDFADVEQLSLRLLRDEASPAARRCRERFTHVFVDEYQDINAAQDAILRAVSRTGASSNRFLVGDIKQSIYRFRLADPRIFAGYAEAWRAGNLQSPTLTADAADGDCKSPPRAAAQSVIPLADNFRSHAAVLDFVNALFRPLMRVSVGGVAYDAAAELRSGRPAATPIPGARVELHVLTSDEAEVAGDPDEARAELEDLLALEREARFVAARLGQLNADGAAWRDMVVLMRSPGSRGEAFAKEFHRAGVPLHAERGGFYEALEVSDLLNLLRLLDNPLQDVPLLAVLRSPLVGLSLEELVAVRVAKDRTLFWDALTKYCAAGKPATPSSDSSFPVSPSGLEKAAEFLTRFAAWRQLIRIGSLTQCLERVLAETHYEALLLAEPRGPERVANVRRLLDLARQFDPLQRQGLHRFLRFLAAQADAELDHDPAPLPTADAVRLMSIHQSKGLEFPVVVLAGMGVHFNLRDLSGEMLLDGDLGLCPRIVPPASQRSFPSLPHWLAKQRGRRESLGEELRLLYVAVTRARDTLVLCGTAKGKHAAAKWRAPATEITDLAVLRAGCALDWLRLWLPSVAGATDWRGDTLGQNGLLSWQLHELGQELRPEAAATKAEPGESDSAASVPEAIERDDEARAADLRAKLTQLYPHAPATLEPAKTSVSVLRRRAEAEEEAFQLFPTRTLTRPRRRAGQLTATQVGVAHHLFLQHVALDQTGTLAGLMAEAERLQTRGVLSAREAEALVFADLQRFWDSELGRRVRANAPATQREVPFTARFSVTELAALTSGADSSTLPPAVRGTDEFVLVQGVVDLAVFHPEGIWLVDYKTDHFAEAELPAKLREHGMQLRLYARALARIYGRTVTRTWLHFLALGRTEEI